jgi:flagellar hook-associated protein 1 FlgK
MSSNIFSILNKGNESLQNSRVGVDVTGHNIANASTEGYSRQQVNLEAKHPIEHGDQVFGDGARIKSIARAHDRFLEGQLRKEVQVKSKNESLAQGLQKLEDLFNPDMTSTIRDRMISFNNALRELSNYPEEKAVRINVVENGQTLAQALNTAHGGVVRIQQDASEEITLHISSLNQKLSEVAVLNGQIREMGAGVASEVNDLEDKRDLLLKQIGDMIDIQAYKDNHEQVVIRGPRETLLVEGDLSAHLFMSNTSNTDELPKLYISEFNKNVMTDVTETTHNGKIGALLEVRDKHAGHLRNTINQMAAGFGKEFNEIHAMGYGIHGYKNENGRNFFDGLDGPGDAARDIHVNLGIVSDPSSVGAALTPNSMGDNVIANKLIKMMNEPLFENNTVSAGGMYDNMVAKLGLDSLRAKESSKASDIIYNKLKTQREAVSGVSLDEEAANLLKYQHLFTASSRIISTADEMMKTILDLKR